jgi:hypothetical protein
MVDVDVEKFYNLETKSVNVVLFWKKMYQFCVVVLRLRWVSEI